MGVHATGASPARRRMVVLAAATVAAIVTSCTGSAEEATPAPTPQERDRAPERFRLWNGTDFVVASLDPAKQIAMNDMYDPAHPGVALAGGWGLEQVLDEGADFRAEAPKDEFRLDRVDLETEHVTVERLFTYRHSNHADPADKPPVGGVTGAFAPDSWNLSEVVDFQPGVVRTGEYFLGGVFRLDEGVEVGRVTGLCVDWAERRVGDRRWTGRSECGELYWILCRDDPEAASCAAAADERKDATGIGS